MLYPEQTLKVEADHIHLLSYQNKLSSSVGLFTYLTYSNQREFSIDEYHLSSDSSKGSVQSKHHIIL